MRGQVKYLPFALGCSSFEATIKMASATIAKVAEAAATMTRTRRNHQATCILQRQQPQANIKFPVLCLKVLFCIVLLHHCFSGQSSSPMTTMKASAAELMEPRITIQPNDLIAIEGESTELNCDAEGHPEPIIEWYHNGIFISSSTPTRTTMGGSIQFLDIRPGSMQASTTSSSSLLSSSSSSIGGDKPTDTGIYYCLAKNSLGIAKSRNASLQVAFIMPELKVTPKEKTAAVGDSVTFECMPDAWPEPSITWRRGGDMIKPGEARLADGSPKYVVNRIAKADLNIGPDGMVRNRLVSESKLGQSGSLAAGETTADNSKQQLIDRIGSQLVIRQADKDDESVYSCVVETKGTHQAIERQSKPAELFVKVKPYFIEEPEHKTVQVGGQVKLRCRMGGDPEPVISWRKQNGQPLSEKTQIDPVDKSLSLDQLTIADQATYVCEGENSVGSARSLATVSVYSRPKFIAQPEDQEVDLGARVQLECSGEASPQPMLYWYKEGHRQLMFAPDSAVSSQQPKHSTSSLLMTSWPMQTNPAQMAPDYRSVSSMSTSDTSPSINKLFTMPTDQLTSYTNNYFGNRIHVDSKGTLNIINVTSSDSGYYACALISSVGSVMAKAKLTVRQSPSGQHLATSDYYDPASSLQDPLHSRTSGASSMFDVSKFELLPLPVIKFGASNQTLPTNTSATLNCEVVSQVAYKIQWFFNSQPLQEEPPRVVVLPTGALSVNNLRLSDSGVYTCVVTAANDQMMPLANPFEPLDSSMLTSAPPTQQSTSHSTMLRVASPMNPNIQFYRMDTFAYPSPPGMANFVSSNGDDAITITWSAPGDSGSLPIKEYVVEHYDTSQEYLGWREIYRVKGKESLLIDGLSADGSHFFVIRAANSHGTGPSSAIAGPFRTIAGDARYRLELQRRLNPSDTARINGDVSNNMRADTRDRLMTISTNLISLTPVSSSSIKLQWSTQITGNLSSIPSISEPMGGLNFQLPNVPDVKNFLEGYSIRYRAIGIGENPLSKEPVMGANYWPPSKGLLNSPSSLPLVTSYINEDEEIELSRRKRDLPNYFDYSQEFNEVRVVDHNTEQYTVNGLRHFTLYQFFVVPYYRDIDGVPSNILTAQTNEDRPSVAPRILTVRPLNTSAVRLEWIHVPPLYANGILRGYVARVNRSDINDSTGQLLGQSEPPKILNLPIESLGIEQRTGFSHDTRVQPNGNSIQQYVAMYDITNLTYKSFYSIQLAASTNAGPGPWSESQNFIMDPQILSQQRFGGNEVEDVMSKSLISTLPQVSNGGYPSLYLMISTTLGILSILSVVGFLLYRRNNQKVLTWKKTISEHFTNKFYMPSNVDHRSNSIQQNIYDHQQHLIYSGSAHLNQQTIPSQAMWGNNACVNSSGNGSMSSHGALLPINNDPNNLAKRLNGEQIVMMNNKDMNTRFAQNNPRQLLNQQSVDSAQSVNQQQNQIVHHGGGYYSVINNAAEYEELDSQRRNNMHIVTTNADRHMTASSNSDTSCPSSVTRLLPGQNYNRDLLSRTLGDNQRHEMVLQQQVSCNDGKQAFATMMNGGETNRMQPIVPLSPYATTNLNANQGPMQPQQQLFSNHQQISLMDHHSRQQNFIPHMHNGGGITMDDSAKTLLNQHQQVNGVHNPMSAFRTLQRNPISFQQQRGQQQHFLQAQPQVFMQADNKGNRFNNNQNLPFQANSLATNITSNPLSDMKSNLYEHVDYSDLPHNQQLIHSQQRFKPQHHQQGSQASNDMISSSTSSGSMKSSQQQSPDQQNSNASKFTRRGSAQAANVNLENESHDLHVFSNVHVSKQSEFSIPSERQRLNGGGDLSATEENCEDEDGLQANETTAFRQKNSSQSDNQRTRQLSKRKRQQQRNRLHNNNQKIG